ncbi:hypothetical protein HD806DRAFT_156014 [Xylariaceae sp. AK1471]|nr:hypothetical protein HD806DRAFT_156014 [Xylariaceae sp. AK1471]
MQKEQMRTQAEGRKPLFESLAVELLKEPNLRLKLMAWDKKKQEDVVKVFTPYELREFEGYENYHEGFLDAMRATFERHYINLRKGLPLVPHLSSTVGQPSASTQGLNNTGSHQPAGLPRQSVDPLDDPFMDKFNIPNRIINGIVIADGTSKTAARRAEHKGVNPFIPSANNMARQKVQNDGADMPPSDVVRDEDVSPCSKMGTAHRATHRSSTSERCSSAPSKGGKLAALFNDPNAPFTDETRVYPGEGHEVDQKLMGCQKPVSPKTTSDDALGTADAPQAAVLAPDSSLQQLPNILNQALPLIPIRPRHDSRHASGRRSSSVRQLILPSPSSFSPGVVPSSQIPETREPGMSQVPFANQIPTYALSQHMQVPSVMQQAQFAPPVHVHSNGGIYNANSIPPYMQTESMAKGNTSTTPAGGSASYLEPKRNHGTRQNSNGRWQTVGSDDIHGPKAIFRKGSVHGQQDQNHRAGQWQLNVSNELGTRPSNTKNNGNYRRYGNAPAHQYSNNTGLRYSDANRTISQPGVGLTGPYHGSNSWVPANLSHSLSTYRCVNHGRLCDIRTKFDPCPCPSCSDRDRTIYVSQLKRGISQTEQGKEQLTQHFSKFGQVEGVIPLPGNVGNSVHVKFLTSQAAVAAVHAERFVKIEQLGSGPLKINFRTGSQFFNPIPFKHSEVGFHNQHRLPQNAPQEQQLAMPHLLTGGPNNSNLVQYGSVPEEPAVSATPMVPVGSSPSVGSNAVIVQPAMGLSDRALTQSGFGRKETDRSPRSGMSGSPLVFPLVQCTSSIDTKGISGTAEYQPQHRFRYGEPLLQDTSQNLNSNIEGYYDIVASEEASHHGTQNNTVPASYNASLMAISLRNAPGSPTPPPKNRGPTKLDDQAGIDFGTVRVRPEKANYMTIPPDWRQASTSLHPIQGPEPQIPLPSLQGGQISTADKTCQTTEPSVSTTESSQQMQTTEGRSEGIVDQSQHETYEKKLPSDHEQSSELHDTNSHAKRKSSETNKDGTTPGQSSPQKKVAKIDQLCEPRQEPQSSQLKYRQHQDRVGGHGQPKGAKKKNNKNKPNRKTGPQLPMPNDNNSTAGPYKAQTFQPAIAASQFPLYPPQAIQGVELQTTVPHIPGPVYVHMPPTPPAPIDPQFGGSEPFPPYRDTMSSLQIPIQGHKSHTTGLGPNRSVSSDASTTIQDIGRKAPMKFNPSAQNFIPSPKNISPTNSISTIPTQASRLPNPQAQSYVPHLTGLLPPNVSYLGHQVAPQMQGQVNTERGVSNAFASGNALPKATNKERNDNRTNAGAKQGGGNGKSKNTKWVKNNRRGGNLQSNTNRKPHVPVDQKAEPAKPEASKDATNNKTQAPINQKVEVSKQPDPVENTNSNRQLPVTEDRSIEASSNLHGSNDVKPGQVDKGKGKEVIIPKAPVTNETKSHQVDKGKGKEVIVPEKAPMAKETEAASSSTAEAKANNDKNGKGQDPKNPESRTGMKAAEASNTTAISATTGTTAPAASSAASTSTNPKQGRPKNRPTPKRDVGAQPAGKSSSGAENTTTKNADSNNKSTHSQSRSQASVQSLSQTPVQAQSKTQPSKGRIPPPPSKPAKPFINSDDFPALPGSASGSGSQAKPALAPIPLFAPKPARAVSGAWEKVGSTSKEAADEGMKTQNKEKGPPDGERKGG